jgi:hypothetical protein
MAVNIAKLPDLLANPVRTASTWSGDRDSAYPVVELFAISPAFIAGVEMR